MIKPQFKIGTFAIIIDEQDRVLLYRRKDYNMWSLPGCGLERGESPWHEIVQCLRVRLGIDAKVNRLAGVYAIPNENEIAFTFLCDIVDDTFAVNDEIEKFEYFKFENLPSDMPTKHIERVRDALEKKKDATLKVQSEMTAE